MSDTATTIDRSAFEAEHARWHERVEARRTAPYGPLSVTSLRWLGAEPQCFAQLPGAWRAEADGTVIAELAEGESLVLDGETITGELRLGPLAGIETATVEHGELRIEAAARGGSIALRVRDPRSSDRVDYPGTAVFPPEPRWVVDARFVPVPQDDVEVDSIIPGKPQHYDSPGVAEFELDGRALRLVLFRGAGPDGLRAIFADADERTFPAARNVEVERIGPDAVRIDFNRATNPPCAYSAGATCPLPPPGNRLPVPIPAGEAAPGRTPHD